MKCRCDKKEEREIGWRTDSYFSSMEEISTINDGWRVIVVCPVCEQHWLVDEYDKVQSLYAFKIDNPDDITESKFLSVHTKYLLKAHNGESKDICRMARCNNHAVNDFVFCAKCLIQKQGVYQ